MRMHPGLAWVVCAQVAGLLSHVLFKQLQGTWAALPGGSASAQVVLLSTHSKAVGLPGCDCAALRMTRPSLRVLQQRLQADMK